MSVLTSKPGEPMATEEEHTVVEHAVNAASDTWVKAEHHHRHEFLADRLQAYSDAVFAIVGTILIVYIQNTAIPKFEEHDESLRQQIIQETPFYTVYHFTFLHISIVWLNHSRVFSVIERVDDVLIWMNLVLLYIVSFVPLTFGVLGEFNDTYAGIVIPSLQIIATNTIMAVIVWYVFRKRRFLPHDMSAQMAEYTRRAMYIKLLLPPVFAILAIAFGKANLLTAQIFFYSSIFVVFMPKFVAYLMYKKCNNRVSSLVVQALSVTVSKERVEFFTDGVYSIIATLVILDITTIGIPSQEVVDSKYNGDLLEALLNKKVKYSNYFATFLLISLLWFVHHSIFNFIKQLNPLMFVAHQCSLSFVGVVPAAIELFAAFFNSSNADDEVTTMQIVAISIMIVGLLQFVLLALMYFADDDCVDRAIFHTKSSLHLLLKVTIIPVTGLAAYWASLGSVDSLHYSFYLIYFCMPLLFIAINIVIKSTRLHSLCWYCCDGLITMIRKQFAKAKY